MNPKLAILAGIGLFACALIAATQARAEDAPVTEQNCYTLDEMLTDLAARDGTLISKVDVQGEAADKLVIFESGGLIQVAPVWHNCIMHRALPLITAEKPGNPV